MPVIRRRFSLLLNRAAPSFLLSLSVLPGSRSIAAASPLQTGTATTTTTTAATGGMVSLEVAAILSFTLLVAGFVAGMILTYKLAAPKRSQSQPVDS